MKKLLPYVLTAFLTLGTIGVYGQKRIKDFDSKKIPERAAEANMDPLVYFLTKEVQFNPLSMDDPNTLNDTYFLERDDRFHVIVRIPNTDYFAHGSGDNFGGAKMSADSLSSLLEGISVEELVKIDGSKFRGDTQFTDRIITGAEYTNLCKE